MVCGSKHCLFRGDEGTIISFCSYRYIVWENGDVQEFGGNRRDGDVD